MCYGYIRKIARLLSWLVRQRGVKIVSFYYNFKAHSNCETYLVYETLQKDLGTLQALYHKLLWLFNFLFQFFTTLVQSELEEAKLEFSPKGRA